MILCTAHCTNRAGRRCKAICWQVLTAPALEAEPRPPREQDPSSPSFRPGQHSPGQVKVWA